MYDCQVVGGPSKKVDYQEGKGEEEKKEGKPKRLFVPPGGKNSAFQQIMREQMNKGQSQQADYEEDDEQDFDY